MLKPILCLDFDGVLHSYTSGWQGASVIPDPPVFGMEEFLTAAVERFEVHIYSSRSHLRGGRRAMKRWIRRALNAYWGPEVHAPLADRVFRCLHFPRRKPPALVTLDDRAIRFTGEFPSMEQLIGFRPWNRRGI